MLAKCWQLRDVWEAVVNVGINYYCMVCGIVIAGVIGNLVSSNNHYCVYMSYA